MKGDDGTGNEQFTLEVLSAADCERLLRKEHLGRVGIVLDGEPVVLPVNYTYDDGAVVFCTGVGSVLAGAAGPGRVAFEIDAADSKYHAGWSVLVHGHMEAVTNGADLARIDALPVRSWVAWPQRRWLRIRPWSVSGRRIRRT